MARPKKQPKKKPGRPKKLAHEFPTKLRVFGNDTIDQAFDFFTVEQFEAGLKRLPLMKLETVAYMIINILVNRIGEPTAKPKKKRKYVKKS